MVSLHGVVCPVAVLVAWLVAVQAFPNTIPIGVLLDRWSSEMRSAVRYETKRLNEAATFNLTVTEFITDSDDSRHVRKTICDAMARGIVLLVGATNISSLPIVAAYTRSYKMPYVSAGHLATDVPGFSVQLWPQYQRAVVDLLKHYRWKGVYYLYDTLEGLARLQTLFGVMRQRDSMLGAVRVIRVDELHSSYLALRHADESSRARQRNIVLELSTDDGLNTILKHIQNVGMNRVGYNYILGGLSMDALQLNRFTHGGVNITGFRFLDPRNRKLKTTQNEWFTDGPGRWKSDTNKGNKLQLETALLLDALAVAVRGLERLRQRNKDTFRRTFRHGRLYNRGKAGVSCKRPDTWEHGERIIRSLREVEFDGNTGWISFDERTGARKGFTLDVLQLQYNTPTRKIGTWSDTRQRLALGDNRYSGARSRDTAKADRPRIVTTVLVKPYMMLRTRTEGEEPFIGNERYEGFCADLAKEVAKMLDFSYVIKVATDRQYGKVLNNGTWNGMIGELTKRTADLAIAPLTITSIRERVIDFSKPFMSLGISIMIKKPEKQKPGIFSFMNPLAFKIWMYIVLAYLAVSVGLFLVSRFSPYEWQMEDGGIQGPSFTNDFTMLNSLWFALSAIMRQGCDISPRSMSGRIVGAAWWFFTLILISSYTANLVAFLTVERMLTPIESADDLSKQTEIQYGTQDDGSTKRFFQTSQISVYSKMWNFMEATKPSVFTPRPEDGVQRVRSSKGKYAFLLESTTNDYYNQRKPCNTMKVGGNLDAKGYGIGTPLDSNIREEISVAVLKLQEDGTLQKLKKKWWFNKGECGHDGESQGSQSSPLTLSNVAGIFYILVGGLGLAMLFSIVEFFEKQRSESSRQRAVFAASMNNRSEDQRKALSHDNGTYSQIRPSQMIGFDGGVNTHTQV